MRSFSWLTNSIIICTILLVLCSFVFLIINSEYFNLLWSSVLIDIQSLQRGFHLKLSQSIRNIETHGIEASISLIGLSFFYGVFHAVGPGHGKIIISTYLITQESRLKSGIILSLISSLVQGLTAILLITCAILLLDFTMRETNRFASDIEIASFMLIAVVGLTIIFSRIIRISKSFNLWLVKIRNISKYQVNINNIHKHSHGHSHSHDHNINDLNSIKSFIGIIISIGIRPCSGAVVVLLLAYSIGLEIAGILAVLSMSLGTALTTSFLAALSVYGRKIAIRILSILPDNLGTLQYILDWIGLIGGIIIFLFGFVFLQASLNSPNHPFM